MDVFFYSNARMPTWYRLLSSAIWECPGKEMWCLFPLQYQARHQGKMPVSRSSSENCCDIYEHLMIISWYWILFVPLFSFLSENIRCKEALVTSACGEHSGLLAFHVAEKTMKNSDRCDLRLGNKYHGENINLAKLFM